MLPCHACVPAAECITVLYARVAETYVWRAHTASSCMHACRLVACAHFHQPYPSRHVVCAAVSAPACGMRVRGMAKTSHGCFCRCCLLRRPSASASGHAACQLCVCCCGYGGHCHRCRCSPMTHVWFNGISDVNAGQPPVVPNMAEFKFLGSFRLGVQISSWHPPGCCVSGHAPQGAI